MSFQFLISDKNSSLVFGLFLNTPSMQLVMVELPGFYKQKERISVSDDLFTVFITQLNATHFNTSASHKTTQQ